MADINFNSATFKMVMNADGTPTGHTEEFTVGSGPVDAGQPVYLDTAGKVVPGQSIDTTKSKIEGVACTLAYTDQQVVVATSGDFDVTLVSGTMKAGDVHILSVNSGRVAPIADYANPNYLTFIFLVLSPTRVRMFLNTTGIQKAP